jgi:hypothetical protein
MLSNKYIKNKTIKIWGATLYGPHIPSSRQNTFHTHRPSRFMPYFLDRKLYTTSLIQSPTNISCLAHSQLIPTNTTISHYSTGTSPSFITSPETSLSIPSPPEKPPFTYPRNVSMVTTPSLVSHSRGRER